MEVYDFSRNTLIHRSSFLWVFLLSIVPGMLEIVQQYLGIYLVGQLGITPTEYELYGGVLNMVILVLYPLFLFVFFYFQGKKVDMRMETKSIVSSLCIGGFLGGYVGRILGLYFMLPLIWGRNHFASFVAVQFPSALLGLFPLFLSSWGGMALGFLRIQKETS